MSDQIRRAWLDFAQAIARERPTLVVVEDLHWGDALTVKLLEAALRSLEDAPLMILVLARPEVDALVPRSWSEVVQAIPLRPLARRPAERLVRQMLGDAVSSSVVERIVEQSAGNALFLEELIRSVAEGKGTELPETVIAMLQGRIGALQTGARRLLRLASVFGAHCRGGALASVLGSSRESEVRSWLALLAEHEIVELRGDGNSTEVRFRHALVRDAAYALLSEEERWAYHKGVGERLDREGSADALTLAQHFERAQAYDRAVPHWIDAAELAAEAHDFDAASSYAARGLACGATGASRGALLAVSTYVHLWREEYDRILDLGAEALGLLDPGGVRGCRVFNSLLPATAVFRPDSLPELAGRFMAVEPAPDAAAAYIRAATWLAVMFNLTAQGDAARALLARMRAAASTLPPTDLVTAGHLAGAEASFVEHVECDPWRNFVVVRSSVDALREGGDARAASLMASFHGKALLDLGDPDAAEPLLRDNVRVAEVLGEDLVLAYARFYLARHGVRHGEGDALDAAVGRAEAVLGAKNVTLVGLAHGAIGEAHARRGDLVAAEASLRVACDLLRVFPSLRWDAEAALADVVRRGGRADEALAIAKGALDEMARTRCSGFGDVPVRLAYAEACRATSRDEDARAALADAERVIDARAAKIPDDAARERYVTRAWCHARVHELSR